MATANLNFGTTVTLKQAATLIAQVPENRRSEEHTSELQSH